MIGHRNSGAIGVDVLLRCGGTQPDRRRGRGGALAGTVGDGIANAAVNHAQRCLTGFCVLELSEHSAVDVVKRPDTGQDSGQTDRNPQPHQSRPHGTRRSVRVALDVSVLIQAGVLDLLEHQDAFGKGCPLMGLSRCRDRRGRLGWRTYSAHDQGARHAAGYLQRRRAVTVRVIPVRSGWMVRRHIVLVLEADARIDRDQDFVAVSVRITHRPCACRLVPLKQCGMFALALPGRRYRRQLVVQRHSHRLPRTDLDGRRDEGRSGIDRSAGIATQSDLVGSVLRRVPQLESV